MIRKLIKFLKKCWGKKAAYAYAGLMLTACILTYKLYFASGSNIFKSEEEIHYLVADLTRLNPERYAVRHFQGVNHDVGQLLTVIKK